MSSDDLVTVIICVYNAGAYFRPSVESIVNQTHRNLDIIIVDDGSTDGCVDSANDIIQNDPRIRLFRQANSGRPAALNRALGEVQGQFYAIQDADDLSHPERIERQLRFLHENPDVAAVFCGWDIIVGVRHMAPHCEVKDREQCRREIASFAMPGHDATPMYRMSLVRNDRFSEDLPYAEGVDFVLRVGEKHPVARIGACLYNYRFHHQSLTKKDPVTRDQFVRAAQTRACQRRGLDFQKVFSDRGSTKLAPDCGILAQFVASARTQKVQGLRRGALLTGLQAVGLHPTQWQAWKALVYAVTPISIIQTVRGRRLASMVDRGAVREP